MHSCISKHCAILFLTNMATLQNLEAETVAKLENRTTDTANVDRYLRDALIELTSNPDLRDSFPELEVEGPQVNLTGGAIGVAVQEYPEATFLTANSGDYNVKTLDIIIWTNFPTNNISKQLNPTSYQDVHKYTSQPSLPTDWYRFGGNIGFDPMPNQNYQVQAFYQRRHPITDYFNTSSQLNTTTLLVPNEWFEIIEWAAAMRGFAELLNFERQQAIYNMLWGAPDKDNKGQRLPGLISTVKTKRRQEAWMQQQPLRPIVQKVCS